MSTFNNLANEHIDKTEKNSIIKQALDALIHDPSSINQIDKIIELQNQSKKYNDDLQELHKNMKNEQLNTENEIQSTNKKLKDYLKTIENNSILYNNYSDNIENNRQLVATRDRMLQISQERNIYKKKIIYILLTIIIGIIIFLISGYTIYDKLIK